MFVNKITQNNKESIYFLLVCSILLLPICFFPYSLDLSIFSICGKTISNGGKLYVDAIDIKAPAIYYFFAFIHKITNSNIIGIRLFDYFWQLITIYSVRKLIINSSNNTIAANVFGVFYSFSYIALNYSCTTQIESFIALPMAIIIHYYLNKEKSIINNIIIGCLIGIIISLKITFGVIVIPFIIDIFITKEFTIYQKIKQIYQISFFSILIFLITFLPLLDKEVYNGFINTNKFLIYYINQPPYNLDLIKEFIKKTGLFLGDNYSITFAFLFSIGALSFLQNKDTDNKFISIVLMQFVLMFICIFVEKKLFQYHYSRIYLFTSIISAFGFAIVYHVIFIEFNNYNRLKKIVLYFLITFLLIISPLPRYVILWKPVYLYFTNIDSYYSFFDSKELNNCHLKSEYEIVEYLKINYKQNEKIDVISVGGNTINMMLQNPKYSPLIQSCLYFSESIPIEYKLQFHKDLRNSKWLVIGKKDLFIFNTNTSWESLKNDTLNYKYVMQNFILVKELPTYNVFKRK